MPDFAESLRESIPTVMRALAQARNNGVLHIRGRDAEAEIMFVAGEIVWARASTARRLGEALEERGEISANDLLGVLAIQKRKKQRQPIATILIELGLLDREVAETEIEIQILDVLRLVFDWGGGEYNFEALNVGQDALQGVVLPTCGKVDRLLQGAGVPI